MRLCAKLTACRPPYVLGWTKLRLVRFCETNGSINKFPYCANWVFRLQSLLCLADHFVGTSQNTCVMCISNLHCKYHIHDVYCTYSVCQQTYDETTICKVLSQLSYYHAYRTLSQRPILSRWECRAPHAKHVTASVRLRDARTAYSILSG